LFSGERAGQKLAIMVNTALRGLGVWGVENEECTENVFEESSGCVEMGKENIQETFSSR
jgi:hypothetical protein